MVPPAPALEVLEDAELAEAPAAAPGPAPAGTLRRRLDGGAEEGLLHDPLRLHKVGGRKPTARTVLNTLLTVSRTEPSSQHFTTLCPD